MFPIADIYRHNLSLLTDLYQLTMAYGYWKLGRADEEAVFHLFFRKPPFGSGYTIAAGLEYAIEALQGLRFDASDREYLGTLQGNDGQPLFDHGFLDYLGQLRWNCDVDAIPEGTVVYPHEPLIRVRGPILQCQLVETILLNLLNFQTLLATKATRICAAARGEPVLEFGLRRAQGIDGALTASRAAYIGGCVATSNVLAGKVFGIPVKGTHAHSWIMSFDSEPEAFEAYARAMPNNCVFLVDTYDTLDGVRNAIEVGKQLRHIGHEMVGIRLDSGDLAYLSIEARKLLDAAGFPQAIIIGSNDLDEGIIESLKLQGATINVWGVGTKLVTSHDQPALGGVYKLGAVRARRDQPWQMRVKVSEQAVKTTNPGILQVRRFTDSDGLFAGDMIYDQSSLGPTMSDGSCAIVDLRDATRRKHIGPEISFDDLLIPVFRNGKRVYDCPPLLHVRQRVQDQLAKLHPSVRRFLNPHEYPAGLEQRLHEMKHKMVLDLRGQKQRKDTVLV